MKQILSKTTQKLQAIISAYPKSYKAPSWKYWISRRDFILYLTFNNKKIEETNIEIRKAGQGALSEFHDIMQVLQSIIRSVIYGGKRTHETTQWTYIIREVNNVRY